MAYAYLGPVGTFTWTALGQVPEAVGAEWLAVNNVGEALAAVIDGRAEAAEGECEVSLVLAHAREKISQQRCVVIMRIFQANLAAQAIEIGFLEMCLEACERCIGTLRCLCFIGKKHHQTFRQPRQIPLGDRGLVGIGIATLAIDERKDRAWMIGFHKSARAVINRLA